ncbi:hypothetical protein [Floridanema aerugineum]|uniref:Uncharacterized protein n=1 Tax=Floridaenema aerugineum BLCC-F46 TaxID=3153654 RepID=A0ABV4XHR5_9CYAN
MIKLYKGIESKPSLLVLHQIEVAQESSGTAQPILKKVSETLKEWDFNLALPIVCVTDEEDKYHLLTGLPIYEAAVAANLERIWVFLIAAKQAEAEKAIEHALLQSKLNDRVVEPQDVTEFLDFINNAKANLTSIPGVKDGYARLIKNNRPYNSLEDMQKKLGAKRSLNWLRAYKHKQ